jgi:hypothetical protein
MAGNIDSIQDVVAVYGGSTVSMQGWQCGCGAWVPNGVTHQCQSEPRWVNLPMPRLSDEDVERIARRVVELLDARAT